MLQFTRGDTYAFKFQRTDANGEVIKSKSEKMIFTIKKNYNTKSVLVQKTLEDGDITFTDDFYYHIVIEPEDTQNLKYTKYVCDIEVENLGVVKTIYKDSIKLTEEVTF